MKALAVTSKERMPQLPNVPTMLESGLKDFDVTSWQAVAVPKGTPKDIVNRMSDLWVAAERLPHFRALWSDVRPEPAITAPAAARAVSPTRQRQTAPVRLSRVQCVS